MIELNAQVQESIKKHALKESPKECCGVIVQKKKEITIINCENISKSPEKSFVIDNKVVNKIGLDNITCYYHSHKNNLEFSLADIAFSEKLRKPCLLYINDFDAFKIYEPNGRKIPYENRPFFIGVLDCFTLFKDYYKRELNLTFPEIQHPERFNNKVWEDTNLLNSKYNGYVNVIREYYSNNSFVEVKNLKKHDILIMQLSKMTFPTHIAIYLNDNRILHHFYEFSQIESYKQPYKRWTTNIFRHRNLL